MSAEPPKFWSGVVVQGSGSEEKWVTSFRLSYTLNGRVWRDVEDGKVFAGNTDSEQKKKHSFSPLFARALRIYPQTWKGEPALRFDAIFLDVGLLRGAPRTEQSS